jgi:hypothetical protein
MVLVKNKLNQPLVINIPDSTELIFLAKQQKEVSHTEFQAPEMKNHVELGNIVVLRISE